MNLTVKWMNVSYFEMIFAIFVEKTPFLSILDTFWAIFGHFSYSTSINDPLTIKLNYLLNWISRLFLNWIIFWIESWAKQYWIEYWKNHFLANSNIELNQIGYWTPLLFGEKCHFNLSVNSLGTLKTLRQWKRNCLTSL